MTEHGKMAEELFREGYNCAQSVFIAFCDLTGYDKAMAAAVSSSFGGGLGRMREICGAVSGAAMVFGVIFGYTDPKNKDEKREHYRLIQEFCRRFKEENGSIVCKELLKAAAVGGEPEDRTAAYYNRRPCPSLVRIAADITEEMVNERQN